MGIPRPKMSDRSPLEEILSMRKAAGGGKIERCLVYAPDAMGSVLFRSRPELLSEVLKTAPVSVGLRSVFPPKTPVCFASMFTGASPAAHGIRAYDRPVLECDTLFDVLIGAGRRPAIATVEDASVDVIFRGRSMDYFSAPTDGDVTVRALDLIESGIHDLILVYHQEYDDSLHETDPFDPGALAAAARHIEAFSEIAGRARDCYKGRPYMLIFAPDHGAHADPETGRGTHGDDIPEDMEVLHFFDLAL